MVCLCLYTYPIMMLTYFTFTASLEQYLIDAGFKEINLNLKEESRAIISQGYLEAARKNLS